MKGQNYDIMQAAIALLAEELASHGYTISRITDWMLVVGHGCRTSEVLFTHNEGRLFWYMAPKYWPNNIDISQPDFHKAEAVLIKCAIEKLPKPSQSW